MVNVTESIHIMQLDVRAERMVKALDAAEKELGQLSRKFDESQRRGQAFTKQIANTNRALKGNSQLAKQAGVQFGDLLVQIGGGQNALLSFAQQANQLGAFMAGPWGIAFTVATGVLAAFGTQILTANKELFEMEAALEAAEDAAKDLNRQARINFTGLSPAELDLIDQHTAAMERLAAARKAVAEAEASGELESLALLDERVKAEEAALRAIEDQQQKLQEAQENYRQSKEFAAGLRDLVEDVARLTGQAADEAGRLADELSLGAGYYTAATRSGIVSGDVPPWAAEDLPPTAGQQAWERILQARRRAARRTDTSGGGSRASDTISDVDKLTDALERAQKQADQFGESLDVALGGVASSALDDFVDGLVTGELAFKDFARSVLNDLAKIMVRAIIVNSLMSAFGGVPGNPSGTVQSIIQGLAGVSRFARGGVVNGPTLFPMSGGRAGLMGEAGAEAIVPLQRDGSGNLGVGASPVNISITNHGVESQVTQEDGVVKIINRAVQAVRNDFSKSMVSGQGTFARALEAGYGTRRKAT